MSKINDIYKNALILPFDDASKIILMSDCHRGDGSWADDFARNQNIYFSALTSYFDEGFTYIEIGDGDELWKNKTIKEITEQHSHIYWLLSKFHKENRLYMMYGNHDSVKKKRDKFNKSLCKDHLYKNINFYEGIVLKSKKTKDELFLLHGHQGDLLNDKLSGLSRFLVRYLWRGLEILGVNDPTSPAKNNKSQKNTEERLIKWTKENKKILIAGHTHRPEFPKLGDRLYFNDGSCIHPRCITGLEINKGSISLIKWSIKTNKEGLLYVGKDILAGPRKINDYYKVYKLT